jgi:hypothetical protein
LERNCPVHTRRKKRLMIFVGVTPFTESESGNVFFLSTDRRMSARWRVVICDAKEALKIAD